MKIPFSRHSQLLRGLATKAARTTAKSAVYICISAFALLVGCAAGPKYRPPGTQLQPFHNAPAIVSRVPTAGPPPLDTWWKSFNDPELTRIVERALDQNLDLQAAMARVQQARAAAKEARARRLPSGDLNAQSQTFHQSLEGPVGRFGPSLPGYSRDQAYYDLNIGASWEADIF